MRRVNDRIYFANRHAAETAAAKTATSHAARLAHLEMALRYSLLAAQECQSESVAETNNCGETNCLQPGTGRRIVSAAKDLWASLVDRANHGTTRTAQR